MVLITNNLTLYDEIYKQNWGRTIYDIYEYIIYFITYNFVIDQFSPYYVVIYQFDSVMNKYCCFVLL